MPEEASLAASVAKEAVVKNRESMRKLYRPSLGIAIIRAVPELEGLSCCRPLESQGLVGLVQQQLAAEILDPV